MLRLKDQLCTLLLLDFGNDRASLVNDAILVKVQDSLYVVETIQIGVLAFGNVPDEEGGFILGLRLLIACSKEICLVFIPCDRIALP